MNQVGHALQVRGVAAPSNEAHESRHVVDVPYSSGASKAGRTGCQGIENHRKFELGDLVVAWCEQRINGRRHFRHKRLAGWHA